MNSRWGEPSIQDKIYLVLVLRYFPFQEEGNLLFELWWAIEPTTRVRVKQMFTVMEKKRLEFNFFLKQYPMSKSSSCYNPTPAIMWRKRLWRQSVQRDPTRAFCRGKGRCEPSIDTAEENSWYRTTLHAHSKRVPDRFEFLIFFFNYFEDRLSTHPILTRNQIKIWKFPHNKPKLILIPRVI
jgi:hypothetical protein